MKLTKTERSWVLYDVANSAFILIITATIPIYFRDVLAIGLDKHVVSQWMYIATSASVLVLVVLSPILGAIADYQGMKKKLFVGFLLLGILMGLSFTVVQSWQAFLLLFVLARIGYSACNVFYDSMLVDVANDDRMDALSGYGYAFGYIGSTIPFIAGITLIFIKPFGISVTLAIQLSFLITFLWWGLLSIPLLKNVKQTYSLPPQKQIVRKSFGRIGITFKKIRENKKMLFFIIGYFLYIDGVYTIISSASTFGGEVGINSTAMIAALLLTQFVAFPFAILAGPLAKKFGALTMIKFYILIYIFVAIFGFQLSKTWEFWVLAIIVGLAQGGIQSISRSYFGKIVPKDESNEYFGFLDIFGKFADFFGPIIMAISALLFHSSRIGILFLVVFFIAGFFLIDKVDKLEKLEKQ
jgi:MFS transporter, UMF1 family